MNYSEEVIHQIELHSPEGIKECFSKGVSPNDDFKGQPLIYELISEYTRSPRFKDCVRVFVDHGMRFEDEILLSVLLDDITALADRRRSSIQLIKILITPLTCSNISLPNLQI
jgi:hypothetical protein